MQSTVGVLVRAAVKTTRMSCRQSGCMKRTLRLRVMYADDLDLSTDSGLVSIILGGQLIGGRR